MNGLLAIPDLVARQTYQKAVSTAAAATSKTACTEDNEYDGRIGLRISAIFVILLGSFFGMLHINAAIMQILTCNHQERSFLSMLDDTEVSVYQNGHSS